MGKRIERNVEWMDDVAKIINLNYRPGSEHTVEYEDKAGNYCVVRVPASFMAFWDMLNKPTARRGTLRKVA